MYDVGGDIGVGCLVGTVLQVDLTPVKFVVSECCHVIAHGIVSRDGRYPFTGGCAVTQVRKQAALHFIACIHQQDIISSHCGAYTIDNRSDASAAWVAGTQGTVQLSVEVIGMKDCECDGDRRGCGWCSLYGRGKQGKQGND